MITLTAASVRIGSTAPYARPIDLEAPRSEGLTEALLEALSWLEYGILLVDQTGQTLFANSAADTDRKSSPPASASRRPPIGRCAITWPAATSFPGKRLVY